MFFLKKLIFKLMELGLGLKTHFSLETKNPIFVNFKLNPDEADAVRKSLPPGVELQKIRFCQSDPSPEYWVSFNLYELKYPKKELSQIRKVRCEINTFVKDAGGRLGIYVFCGSPYVSREKSQSLMGRICDLAERLVMFIYGCGKLIGLDYRLSEDELEIEFEEGGNAISLKQTLPKGVATGQERLSDDYFLYNDISFFNCARTYDLVSVSSAFILAKFERTQSLAQGRSPFFCRAPDAILFHRGSLTYSVNALNRAEGP